MKTAPQEVSVADLVLGVLEVAGVKDGALREELVRKAEKLVEARALQLTIEGLPPETQTKIAALPDGPCGR